MILKASQRGGGLQLARHLMNIADNDHVDLHEMRGFIAGDLEGALKEAYAISRGTRCQQFLFSVSLNPPETEHVPVPIFEAAVQEIEERVGLSGQPRAIVFHEKQGRRHAHAVWSRIDARQMKAINLPHFKLKLRDISRELYREHGWTMPRGLIDGRFSNPLNFSLAEWQQAQRIKSDPRQIKEMLRVCWASSPSRRAFEAALEERGYYLARGDRRGHVAVDWRGGIHSLSRCTGASVKDIQKRLGDPAELRSAAEIKISLAERLAEKLGGFRAEEDTRSKKETEAQQAARRNLILQQRQRRSALRQQHEQRAIAERKERASQLPTGLRAIWSRITGRYAASKKEIEAQAQNCAERDRKELQALIERQLSERRQLLQQHRKLRSEHEERISDLDRDLETILKDAREGREPVRASQEAPDARPHSRERRH